MVFTVFLLGAYHDKGSVRNKSATSIGIVWQRHVTLCLTPPYFQMVGPSSLPNVVPSQTKTKQTTVHIDVSKTKHLAHRNRLKCLFCASI